MDFSLGGGPLSGDFSNPLSDAGLGVKAVDAALWALFGGTAEIPGVDVLTGLAALLSSLGMFDFGGVPKGAKTAGAAQTLAGEGGSAGVLGKGISGLEGGQGSNVFSNPAFAHETNTLADAITWLTGQALPGWKAMGSTGEIANIKPPNGAPYSKGVNIMGVQSPDQLIAQLGKSPNLTPDQLARILPQLEQLAKTPGMSVAGLKGALGPLADDARAAADTQAYMNQNGQTGRQTIPFPSGWMDLFTTQNGDNRGFDITKLLPLLNFFNFGGNSDNPQNPQNPIQSLFGGTSGGGVSAIHGGPHDPLPGVQLPAYQISAAR